MGNSECKQFVDCYSTSEQQHEEEKGVTQPNTPNQLMFEMVIQHQIKSQRNVVEIEIEHPTTTRSSQRRRR